MARLDMERNRRWNVTFYNPQMHGQTVTLTNVIATNFIAAVERARMAIPETSSWFVAKIECMLDWGEYG